MPRKLCAWCQKPSMHAGATPFRIFDLLDSTDGMWWTAQELADRLGRAKNTINQALRHLRAADALERSELNGQVRYRIQGPPVDRSWPPTVTAGYLCSCGKFLPDPNRLGLRVILNDHRFDHLNGSASIFERVS